MKKLENNNRALLIMIKIVKNQIKEFEKSNSYLSQIKYRKELLKHYKSLIIDND